MNPPSLDFTLDLRPLAGGTHAVLVASGNDAVRKLLWETFEGDRSGYLIHEEDTEDGAVAMTLISRPALVILDSDLKDGSGVGACQRLRQQWPARDCRIVIISGHATPEERQRAREAGADAFLVKPFSPLRLIALAGPVAPAGHTGHTGHTGDRRSIAS
jgi:two-component system chemotaxis response regulator CheY